MLIKFFGSGVGSGGPPTDYVCNEMVPTVITVADKHGKLRSRILRDDSGKPIMKTRIPPPEILAGDRQQTKNLIDSLDFRWKYTSGVIAFAPDDNPTDEDIHGIMQDFENLAFAGLDRDRVDILWVRHTHEGQPELHFVVPRVDLLTQKSLNIAPPGWEKYFDPLRDYWNYKKSWARPDDLTRARLCQPGHVALQQAENLRAGLPGIDDPKKAITGYLTSRIQAGMIGNRADIIDSLKELNLEITREGTDYVSVRLEPGSKPIRLRGIIYGKSFKPEDIFREGQGEDRGRAERNRRSDEDRVREARDQFEEGIRRRAEYNEGRYGTAGRGPRSRDQDGSPGADRPGGSLKAAVDDGGFHSLGAGVEPLDRHLRRVLGADAIPVDGDPAPGAGPGGVGGQGRQDSGDRLRGDTAPLREGRPDSARVPRWLSDFERLLNLLGEPYDGIGKKAVGSLGEIGDAISNGYAAARRASNRLSESSQLFERAIRTAGMIDGMSHGNKSEFK